MTLVTQHELMKEFDTNQSEVSIALSKVQPADKKRPMQYDWDEAQEAIAKYWDKRAEYYRQKAAGWQEKADAARRKTQPE